MLADGLSLKFEWQQVSTISRTLFSILADLNNVVVWMIPACPLISKSSSFNNHSVTVPRKPITSSISVTFLFHSFFKFLSKVKLLIFLYIQKFGTDPILEDQIMIYETKKSILDRPSGPVAQRIEAVSLFGSRWALSEDSGFKSYPSRPEVYLVTKKRGAIDNNYGRQ